MAWLLSGAVPKGRESTGLRLDRRRRAVHRSGRPVDLTSREFALLEQLMEREGEICTAEELVVLVWGTEMANRSDVVDDYVQRLREKLGDDVVETVPGVGYRLGASTVGQRA